MQAYIMLIAAKTLIISIYEIVMHDTQHTSSMKESAADAYRYKNLFIGTTVKVGISRENRISRSRMRNGAIC